ncbi:MAG: DMT family transporter [Firmicutes bacterium]|nr:DMT family transporter [Bacillota bacterium]
MGRLKLFLLLIPLSLGWGLSFLATTVVVRTVDPVPLQAMRWALAGLLCLMLIVFGVIRIDIRKPAFKWMILVGILQPCAYFLCETNGIALTSTSTSAIMIALIPCVTMTIGWLFFGKKINRRVALGIALALAGVLLSTVLNQANGGGTTFKGILFLLMAMITGGLYGNTTKKVTEEYTPMELTCWMALTGLVFFNGLNFAMGYGLSGYRAALSDWHILGCVLFLGVGCSFLCFVILNYIISKMDAAGASNISSSATTMVGVISGIAIAGDPWGWYTIAGLILTVIGVWITSKEAEKTDI